MVAKAKAPAHHVRQVDHDAAPAATKAKPREAHHVLSIAGLGLVDQNAWFAIPIALRQAYWRESDYGRQRASDELLNALAAAGDGLIIEGRDPTI